MPAADPAVPHPTPTPSLPRPNSQQNALQAGLIIAGWDRREGGAVYAIPLGGTMERVPFSIGGSGSAYIYALTDKLWKASTCGWRSALVRSVRRLGWAGAPLLP